MKRREFFTKVALGTAAVAVAPHILAQEPVKALDPYRNVVNNPYYKWVKAKRSSVHVGDNNYWKCLEDNMPEYPVKRSNWMKSPQLRNVPIDLYGDNILHHNIYRRIYPVRFREYDWVMQNPFIRVWNKEGNYTLPQWMNIEDYSFYNDLYEKKVFDPHYSNLLGVGLIPGLVNPLNPRRSYIKPHLRAYPVDSYEIHIMYQKLK